MTMPANAEATPAYSRAKAFFERHCHDCHSGATPEAGLDLSVMPRDFSDHAMLNRFVRIHDRIAKGEMPPAEVERPSAADVAAVTTWLDTELQVADAARIEKSGRARMRRLTRSEFENTLRDLLALDRLDIQSLVSEDGRMTGYDTIDDGLDLSPVHLAAYAAAVERALGAAIATRSTPPPVFRRRVFPASLVKFGGNLTQGNFGLLKERQPDPALPLRGGYEEVEWYINAADADADMAERNQLFRDHKIAETTSSVGLLVPNLAGYEAAMNVAPIWPGRYRLRLSLWGFQWNTGVVEPSPVSQAAVLRAHAEGQQQEGGRLLGTFTAASLAPWEHEITIWLDAHESIVFDPVSIPWRGLQVRQIGGRTKKHVGPGVALDWFEVEGPLNESSPPGSHRGGLLAQTAIHKLTANGTTMSPVKRGVWVMDRLFDDPAPPPHRASRSSASIPWLAFATANARRARAIRHRSRRRACGSPTIASAPPWMPRERSPTVVHLQARTISKPCSPPIRGRSPARSRPT